MQIRIKKRRKNRNRRKKIKLPFITVILLSAFIFMMFSGTGKIDFYELYGISEGSAVIDGVPLNDAAAVFDGINYISLDSVKTQIDPDIYYNEAEGRVIITTKNSVVRLDTDGSSDAEGLALNFSVYDSGGRLYLPAEVTEKIYGYNIIKAENGLLLLNKDYGTAKTVKKTKLYQKNKKTANFYTRAEKNTDIYVLGELGDMLYAELVTGSNAGFVGYIPKNCVSEINEAPQQTPEEKPTLTDGRIILAFDQISNAAGAAITMSDGLPEGVNVLCPTWFTFKDAGGEIINKANADYVNWAHTHGAAVWGLVTDNFDSSVSHNVLSDDKTREYAIQQLIAYADTYGLDGINIDFEAVPKTDGEYWIQFLREFAPVCRSHGLVLSCDTFVPRPWSLYYNRKDAAEVIDYMIVMGYDEHYRGSDSAGSVASLGWSEKALKDTADLGVPKEKIILGIPFYTRIWTESGGEITSSAYSMDAAEEILNDNKAAFSFDEVTGQNYAEYTDSEGLHRCWIEDEQSVKKRIELANQYGASGIAAWKLRMEKDGIFRIINETLEK